MLKPTIHSRTYSAIQTFYVTFLIIFIAASEHMILHCTGYAQRDVREKYSIPHTVPVNIMLNYKMGHYVPQDEIDLHIENGL